MSDMPNIPVGLLITKEGFRAVLQLKGNSFQATVLNSSIPRCYQLMHVPVVFDNSCTIHDLSERDSRWQRSHVQLLPINDSQVLFIGKVGLDGGGVVLSCSKVATPIIGYIAGMAFTVLQLNRMVRNHENKNSDDSSSETQEISEGTVDTSKKPGELPRRPLLTIGGQKKKDQRVEDFNNVIIWYIDNHEDVEPDSNTMDHATTDQTQQHHLIPRSLKNHPAIKESDFEIDDPINLIVCPRTRGIQQQLGTHRSVHCGRHRKAVVNEIIAQLDEAYKTHSNNPVKMKRAVEEIAYSERLKVRSGKRLL